MTGEKNKFTTTEKLWKLDDETLSTPKHDEMVLWLLEKQNIIKLPIVYNFFKNCYWQRTVGHFGAGNLISSVLSTIPDFWSKLKSNKELSDIDIKNVLDDLKKYRCEVKMKEIIEKWESLVKQYIQAENYMGSHHRDINILSEVPITTHNKFIVGYWDIVIDLEQNHKTEDFYFERIGENYYNRNFEKKKIFIEVKPNIKSFGATLRQLKTYIEYLPLNNKNDVCLFTTDTRFRNAFETQGIKILDYPQDDEK